MKQSTAMPLEHFLPDLRRQSIGKPLEEQVYDLQLALYLVKERLYRLENNGN